MNICLIYVLNIDIYVITEIFNYNERTLIHYSLIYL